MQFHILSANNSQELDISHKKEDEAGVHFASRYLQRIAQCPQAMQPKAGGMVKLLRTDERSAKQQEAGVTGTRIMQDDYEGMEFNQQHVFASVFLK